MAQRKPNPEAKVGFIISRLSACALQPLQEQEAAVNISLPRFIAHFMEVFSTSVEDLSVGQQLLCLCQGKRSGLLHRLPLSCPVRVMAAGTSSAAAGNPFQLTLIRLSVTC